MPTDQTRAWMPQIYVDIKKIGDLIDYHYTIIEYTREQDICTGVGTLDFTMPGNETTPEMWESLRFNTQGAPLAQYNVISIEKKIPENVWLVSCQDDSIRLVDYFIDQTYEITYPSSSLYWIEKFLTDAGIEHYEVPSTSVMMSENTSLGMTSAYDAITQLCQMNGWAFYFDLVEDPENPDVYYPTCIIKKFSITEESLNHYAVIRPNRVTELGYNKSDKMLRNRAVVWGAGDPDTGAWIYADTSTMTPWNRPNGDYRTIVYSNSAIKTFGIAYNLAAKILNEFSQTIPEKHISGFYNYDDWWNYEEWRYCTDAEILEKGYYLHLMSLVRAYSDKHHIYVSGRITHITENMSKESGVTFTYILDHRCPRLFGYADWNDYVYIGTDGAGVWRKFVYGSTWNNYSTGITNLNIKDLAAYDGLLGAVSEEASGVVGGNPVIDSQLYIRHTSQGSWYPYNPDGFTNYYPDSGTEPEYLTSGIIAEACSIDRTTGITGLVTAGFTIPGSGQFVGSGEYYTPSGNLSWVRGITLDRIPNYTQQVVVLPSGLETEIKKDYAIIDLETNWEGNNILTTFAGTEVEYIPYIASGEEVPGLEYGGDGTSGTHFVYGINSIAESLAYNRNSTAYMPPPTSGYAIEVNYRYDITVSGISYHIGTTVGSSHTANYILEESEDTNGSLWSVYLNTQGVGPYTTTISLSNIKFYFTEKYVYYYRNYSSVPQDWGTYHVGNQTLNFWKIDDNHFTLLTERERQTEDEVNLKLVHLYANDSTGELEITGETDCTYYGALDYPYYDDASTLHAHMWPRIDADRGRGYEKFPFIIQRLVGTWDTGNVEWIIATIDMVTGARTENLIFSPPTSHDSYNYIVGHHTPNYIYYAFCDHPPLPAYPPNRTTHTWYIYLVTLDKNNWSINYTIVPITFEIDDEEDGDIYGIYPERDGYYPKRTPGMRCLNENPDTGVGKGVFLSSCSFWVDANLPTGAVEYNVFCVITFNTPGIGTNLKTYIDKFTAGASPSLPIFRIEAYHPWYLSWGAPGEDWFPTFSRNLTDTPIVMQAYYPNYQYEGRIENCFVRPSEIENNLASPIIPQRDYNYEYQSYGEFATFNVLTNLLDDADNSIYVSYGFNDEGSVIITYGYNLDGSIKKILYVAYDENGEKYIAAGGGAVIQNKTILDYYDNNYPYSPKYSVSFFFNPVTSGYTTRLTPKYEVLYHQPKIEPSGLFTTIKEGYGKNYVDTSKNLPTVVYERPYISDVGVGHMDKSWTNELNSFDTIITDASIYDVRIFDYSASGSPLFTPTGLLSRYIGVAGGKKGLLYYNSESIGSAQGTVLLSGAFNHLDFTNNDSDPFAFTSTSGRLAESGRFFQKDRDEFFWNDYSATLPSGYMITIIRADDRM